MVGALGVGAVGDGQRIGRFPADQAAVDGRVVAADGVMDAADDGQLVGLLGDARQRFGHVAIPACASRSA